MVKLILSREVEGNLKCKFTWTGMATRLATGNIITKANACEIAGYINSLLKQNNRRDRCSLLEPRKSDIINILRLLPREITTINYSGLIVPADAVLRVNWSRLTKVREIKLNYCRLNPHDIKLLAKYMLNIEKNITIDLSGNFHLTEHDLEPVRAASREKENLTVVLPTVIAVAPVIAPSYVSHVSDSRMQAIPEDEIVTNSELDNGNDNEANVDTTSCLSQCVIL